jgi:uncharacterized protein DUF1549/uncharacterized protein DUF1553/cytochrome c
MPRCLRISPLVAAALLLIWPLLAGADEPLSAEQAEFFEAKIRPVLVKHCYECHSADAKKLEGSLKLDSRDGVIKGGEGGAVIKVKDPAHSRLISALKWEELEMPPEGKLPAGVIADFEKWIAMGAPDPRVTGTAAAKEPKVIDFAKAREHWSYRPLVAPPLPAVKNAVWAKSPLDAFVLAKLEGSGLTPSPAADKRTLLRRLYFDLIGLPPTYDEVQALEQDQAADAFERQADRLLASPRYGERWGRHWLDVARYADTKDGVLMYGDDRIRPYAYTYRDYVIRAFNEDLPLDEFIADQLAADKNAPTDQPWRLAAMGYLTLGRMFDSNLHDVYDDRIDTVARGMMGLTVACARCHDHKYDAITQADYYALYGVFASSEAPLELPLTARPEETPGYAEFEAKAGPIRKKLADHIDSQYTMLLETARQRVADYLERVATQKPDPLETAIYYLSLSPDDLRPQIVHRWRKFVARRATTTDPVFGPWSELMAIGADGEDAFTAKAAEIVARWRTAEGGLEAGKLNPQIKEMLTKAVLRSKKDVARAYGELLKATYEASKTTGTASGALDAAQKQLLETVTGPENPISFPKNHAYLYMARVERGTFHSLQGELDKLAVGTPGAPPRAMTLVDQEQLHDPRIFIRGNPNQPGEPVARRFLQLLGGSSDKPFEHGSGRLDLARAITSEGNPLTPRVLANRIWMHHWGEPLVSSPSDFGTRSTPPANPELLDWLAAELRGERIQGSGFRVQDAGNPQSAIRNPQSDWDLKRLHRRIVSSATWQQSSADRTEARKLDPDNRLLWRAQRRRLDLEAMRDGMLTASGRLTGAMYGRPVNVASDPANARRTVYGLVDRQDVPGMYRAFDFASPDQSAERRPNTTTPQQALFAINSPFVAQQARDLSARPEIVSCTSDQERIETLYRLILFRQPAASEYAALEAFLEAAAAEPAADGKLPPLAQLAQVLLLTNEAMFVD